MVQLVGLVGWGLLTMGAVTHVWHHDRLRELLAMHLDNERQPAFLLTICEVVLAVAIPILVITSSPLLPWFAIAGLMIAIGFVVWIGRLLLSGSDLPCACSFSQAPTSLGSLARAVCVSFVGLLAIVDAEATVAEHVATVIVAWAIAAAVFVLPEAVAWPEASKALMARVDAHSSQ